MPLRIRAIVRLLLASLAMATRSLATAPEGSPPTDAHRVSISVFGAVGDGRSVNTRAIQQAIDQTAADGGGTVVIPAGVFISGAVFLKPRVNLYFDEGAVLKASTDRNDFPRQMTRVEGHFEPWLPALLNAHQTDHLRISGSGTLDGSGAPFWTEFWTKLEANRATTNLDVPRARLALIEKSTDVRIEGLTFKDSAFWNLHLYRCRGVLVQRVRFQVPEGARCPSTDGVDIDSSQDVTLRDCSFRVDDDCVAVKGSKGPFALADQESPPVENIRIEHCEFDRGHGAVTLGSEATIVRNVRVDDCRVSGRMPVLRLKLRPDTPQLYEDVHYRGITLDNAGGALIEARPWTQFFDLKGEPPPRSTVRNITMTDVKGSFGAFGVIKGNPGQTSIGDIGFENIDVQLARGRLEVGDVKNLRFTHVTVNGKPYTGDR